MASAHLNFQLLLSLRDSQHFIIVLCPMGKVEAKRRQIVVSIADRNDAGWRGSVAELRQGIEAMTIS